LGVCLSAKGFNVSAVDEQADETATIHPWNQQLNATQGTGGAPHHEDLRKNTLSILNYIWL
jgi:hypothetical protein